MAPNTFRNCVTSKPAGNTWRRSFTTSTTNQYKPKASQTHVYTKMHTSNIRFPATSSGRRVVSAFTIKSPVRVGEALGGEGDDVGDRVVGDRVGADVGCVGGFVGGEVITVVQSSTTVHTLPWRHN